MTKYLPRSVRSSHWSKASIVCWLKQNITEALLKALLLYFVSFWIRILWRIPVWIFESIQVQVKVKFEWKLAGRSSGTVEPRLTTTPFVRPHSYDPKLKALSQSLVNTTNLWLWLGLWANGGRINRVRVPLYSLTCDKGGSEFSVCVWRHKLCLFKVWPSKDNVAVLPYHKTVVILNVVPHFYSCQVWHSNKTNTKAITIVTCSKAPKYQTKLKQ